MARQQLKLATFNMERDRSEEVAAHDAFKLFKRWHPAAMGLQESKQYITELARAGQDLFRVALPMEGRYEKPNFGDICNNPIIYDPEQLRLLRCYNLPVHPGKAHCYPKRIITVGRFKWVGGDGSTVTLHNSQVNSHIEKGGHPRELPRVKLSTHHFNEWANLMVADAKGFKLSFLMGDLNVDEDADNRVDFSGFPNEIFREHHIISIYDELHTPASFDTHGRRKIDVIASYEGDGRVRGMRVINSHNVRTGSDHLAVCATYSIQLMH